MCIWTKNEATQGFWHFFFFEVYGQVNPITPEARKKGSFSHAKDVAGGNKIVNNANFK